MKFYQGFYTDLPDQFVQANADALARWAVGWDKNNPCFRRSMVIDTVSIAVIGKIGRDNWPTFKSASERMINLWMARFGGQFDGRYWESVAEDQRRSTGKSGFAWGVDPSISIGNAGGTVFTAVDLAQAFSAGASVEWVSERRPDLKREGVIAGAIVGYRCWRIQRANPGSNSCVLRSVYQPDVWVPGAVLEGRELGDWDQRGIHAWKDAGSKEYHDYIRSYLNQNSDPFFGHFAAAVLGSFYMGEIERDPRPAMVTGTAFLWGDVVEHERGYRAEFARVRSLDWLYPDAKMMGREQLVLDDLRRLYGVSVFDTARAASTDS